MKSFFMQPRVTESFFFFSSEYMQPQLFCFPFQSSLDWYMGHGYIRYTMAITRETQRERTGKKRACQGCAVIAEEELRVYRHTYSGGVSSNLSECAADVVCVYYRWPIPISRVRDTLRVYMHTAHTTVQRTLYPIPAAIHKWATGQTSISIWHRERRDKQNTCNTHSFPLGQTILIKKTQRAKEMRISAALSEGHQNITRGGFFSLYARIHDAIFYILQDV